MIDGRLDDAVWATAPVIDDFVVSQPNEGDEPVKYTQVYALYNRNSLYLAARAWTSTPDLVVARVLRHGELLFSDDTFEIILDPFNNQRSGYLFAVNPNEVREDAIFENTSSLQFDWDGIFYAAASQDGDGWTVDVEIPFKTLSFDPENETWGINFVRRIPRRGEMLLWVARNRSIDPSVTGKLIGIRDVDQGRGLDVVPSVSVRYKKDHQVSVTGTDFDPSVDLFYKITPSLNASLTANTDFSATEVDDRQVNLTRFNLILSGKARFLPARCRHFPVRPNRLESERQSRGHVQSRITRVQGERASVLLSTGRPQCYGAAGRPQLRWKAQRAYRPLGRGRTGHPAGRIPGH